MEQKLLNKIEAKDTSIKNLMGNQKFTIDYFQREYCWLKRHISQLIEDLTGVFLQSYRETHEREEVANYQNYYLGSVVFSIDEKANKSIVDGQQRITSLTLLLIFLKHRQKNIDIDNQISIDNLIYSSTFGKKSFNMSDAEREKCLTALFRDGTYDPKEEDDETIQNIVERYNDIQNLFPDEIDDHALPYFIDWFIENVILVEITAYSDDNAYTIFETMNDRGLNLTPTEMLKGYVLSKITNRSQRDEINKIWKHQIHKLNEYGKKHNYGEKVDLPFFQAWFRGKYAQTMRPGKAGAENQDFELIGSAFHQWFKDKHNDLFELNTSQKFYSFFKQEFPFFVDIYLKIWEAYNNYDKQLEHVFYVGQWGIAESLQEPLLLASVNFNDNENIINKKLDYVARYIETFTVRRSINYKKFGQTSIRYSMFNVMKSIRNCPLSALGGVLVIAVDDITEKWDGIEEFGIHGQNRNFTKHLLSRITSYVDNLAGKSLSYVNYQIPQGKPFEIEHIWADKFNEHRNEFEQENDFEGWRNSIGALLLLPQGTNQSFNDNKYDEKLKHYIKENTYAQSLNPIFYEKNPNFLNSQLAQSLQFKAHPNFNKNDILERQSLVQRICEQIWSTNYFIE
ncbi:MAG: DUF262 domain-containing HNH endonuclease family protein [Oscillospiraceae bacterium]|nr:DUF262 domain-containing HNH endonuclease family protein [Oscillospiraceae bacterium]